MVGSGKLVVVAVFAVTVGACGTATAPKAFQGPTPLKIGVETDVSGTANDVVVVAPEVVAGWEFLYRFITETEFVLCLEGTRETDRITVDAFRLARMEATSVNSVRYQPCDSPRYVGTAHNHPPVDSSGRSLCYQSEPDRRSFGMDNRAAVDVVICGDGVFRWWMKDGRTASKTITAPATN
ncbi:MAG TPA: hypothetical protein VM100_11825 [Longimicrobiales bacterium]|nr:hypothetical protein [Longimicrobiales bacterium]